VVRGAAVKETLDAAARYPAYAPAELLAMHAAADVQAATPAHHIVGIGFKVAATLGFTVMSTLIKVVGPRYPIGEIVFCRSLFALIPLLLWVGYSGWLRSVLSTRDLIGHIKRSLAGAAAIYLNFSALYFLPIADATAISYAMPLITVVLAVVMLHERVRRYRWLAVMIGFGGVVVILSNYLGRGEISSRTGAGALLAILGAFAAAMAVIQIRTLARVEKTATIVVYFSLFTTLAGLMAAPLGWLAPAAAWVVPDWPDAVGLVAIGVSGGIAQVLTTRSYHHSDASLMAPFEYTSMIWALAASWFVFDTWPNMTVMAGTAIVIGAGLFVVYREQRIRAEHLGAIRKW
jgi:drug/metabolite transporter (DMT)-like permease